LIRKAHRDELKPISGIALAEGLTNYAYPGDEYISSIQSVIQYNQLERYDQLN
jgi:Bax protein